MDNYPPQAPRPDDEGPATPQPYTPPAQAPQPYTPSDVQAPQYQAPMSGGAPPLAPPAGPYEQPQYNQYGPGMPPPPAKKGFPWLPVCGITCLVLLLIAGGITFCSYRFIGPFIKIGLQINKLSEEVKAADPATVRKDAVPVTADELAANPSLYEGKWVAVSGTVSSNGGPSSMPSQSYGNQQTTNYMLGTNVLVMDVNNASPVASPGQELRAYGKFYAMDMSVFSQMPMVGKEIEKEFQKDPTLSKMKYMILFVTKDLEQAAGTFPGAAKKTTESAAPPAAEGTASAPAGGGSGTDSTSGWGQ